MAEPAIIRWLRSDPTRSVAFRYAEDEAPENQITCELGYGPDHSRVVILGCGADLHDAFSDAYGEFPVDLGVKKP